MGAWGDGLLDNDGALDCLADLFDAVEIEGHAELATLVGLETWLHAPFNISAVEDELAEAASLETLPAEVRRLLTQALSDPKAFSEGSVRSPAARGVLGTYCAGPRHDALLRLAESSAVIDQLAGGAAARLDEDLEGCSDLYEASEVLGLLAPLVELRLSGLLRPLEPHRLEQWRGGLARSSDATTEERDFWDTYVAKVRGALDLLQR
jgi:hypothetical protein